MNVNDAASIAALLDQLKESPEWQQIAAPTPPTVPPEQPSVASLLAQLQTPVAPRALTDVRHHTFQQALPALTELAADPAVADVLESIKAEQDALERKLWAEREAVFEKYQQKFSLAQTKAKLIGAAVSQHEVDMINDGFRKELAKFDRERAAAAWDALIGKQQQQLAHIRVPTMFTTSEPEARERQQQVMSVLEALAGLKR